MNSNQNTNCEEYQKLLSLQLDGNEVPNYVNEHIKKCSECQNFVNAAQILKNYIHSELLVQEFPEHLKETTINKIIHLSQSSNIFLERNYISKYKELCLSLFTKPLYSLYFSLLTSICFIIITLYFIKFSYKSPELTFKNSIIKSQNIELLPDNAIRMSQKNSNIQIKLGSNFVIELAGSNAEIKVLRFSSNLFEFEQVSGKINVKLKKIINTQQNNVVVFHNIGNIHIVAKSTIWHAEFMQKDLLKISVAEGEINISTKHKNISNTTITLTAFNSIIIGKDGRIIASETYNPFVEDYFQDSNNVIFFTK